MKPRLRVVVGLVAFAGCSDDPVLDPSVADSSTSEPGMESAPTTTTFGMSDTGSPSSPGESTEESTATSDAGTSRGTDETGESGGSSSESSGGSSSTGGEPSTCGPPCDETWEFVGDLVIQPWDDTSQFVCLTRVVGTLSILNNQDAAALHGLANLREVDGLQIEYNDVLTDLSPFACLERARDRLSFYRVPALTDLSALGGLKEAAYVSFGHTGITALPTFAPDFAGVWNILLFGNNALVDLDAMTGWKAPADLDILRVQIDGNMELADIGGLAPLLASAGDASVSVQITEAPKLASLAGLAPLTGGQLWLQNLPLVPDLEPLASFVDGGSVTLLGMPLVESLHGLHNMTHIAELVIGNCMGFQQPGSGMNGLVDLSGLDALVLANYVSIASNANLAALTGAPLLSTIDALNVIDNPKLVQADVDQLVAQLGSPPQTCVGGWLECSCFQLMPW